jgi:vesicle coat complex subunit
MSDPRFFNTQRKGENYELRAELNSEYRDKRKEAVKKVIGNMTVGKDVSQLFADVVKNMQTEDLELKKLIYLYLINYAKSQPELVILAINTFVKVALLTRTLTTTTHSSEHSLSAPWVV